MAGLSANVRSYRYTLLREFMRKHEYDALVLTGSDWFEWASNHELTDLWFERPFALIVTAGGESSAVLSELSRNSVTTWAQRGQSWVGSYHHYAESRATPNHKWTAPHSVELLAEVLKTAGLARARIAAQSHNDWLERAVALLGTAKLSSAGPQLRSLRWVKHAEEIATMRACASLTDWAIDVFREALRPGSLLEELDYSVCAQLLREAARRFPGENFVIKGIRTLSGAESACSGGAGAQNGRVLEADTIALTGIGTRLNGLAMELGRPWLVGKPEKRIVELLGIAAAAQQAAIDAAVAGRSVSAMHSAAHAVLEAEGLGAQLRIRAGHGIGVIQHDFPVDVPFEDRLLLEHEAYAVEPALYIHGVGGFRYADTVLVGASAAERLTRAPRDLAHLTIS